MKYFLEYNMEKFANNCKRLAQKWMSSRSVWSLFGFEDWWTYLWKINIFCWSDHWGISGRWSNYSWYHLELFKVKKNRFRGWKPIFPGIKNRDFPLVKKKLGWRRCFWKNSGLRGRLELSLWSWDQKTHRVQSTAISSKIIKLSIAYNIQRCWNTNLN